MKKDLAKQALPAFKRISKQPETQTAKANATPRIGQGTRKMSAYHKAFASQKGTYGQATPSYNVGRTRRAGHLV